MRTKIKAVLITWLAVEAGLVALVVAMFGWPTVLASTLLASIVGGVVLSQAGRQVASSLKDMKDVMANPTGLASGARHLAKVIAAILLIVPGFLTDLAALMLLLPPVRDLAIRRFFPAGARKADGAIDLDRDQWRPL